MTALRIIAEEDLRNGVFFSASENSMNAVIIEESSGVFVVYGTDERAAVDESSVMVFSEESSALTEFIERLRAWNEYVKVRNSDR
ncbi:MAG: hypothetical protein LKI24_07680 [Acidipropionibacterium sp.]|jgi:hypothetical protein|nr:hypothetical protein [Acidipropionibacterium sp.]